METLVILVTAAGLSAAAVWWRMSRPDAGRGESRLVGFGAGAEETLDAFVFGPSDVPAPQEDRPARTASLVRLAVAIVVSTLVLVAAVWGIGLLVKLQLDSYFLPSR